jgi:DNA-binding PucR family transcriptional regulator
LEAWDAEHGADLLPTLRAFLDNDGKWRQTARALHIHHNTLKYRAERICALTGRDLDGLRGRIDFALALAVTPLVEMSPADDPKTGV